MIKQCSVAIGNDTGTIHIASYLGKPTFTIYGPTNPVYHLPYGKNHRYIQCRLKCSPLPNEKVCFTFGGRIGCPSNECMNLLSAKDVVDNVYDFIHFLNIEKISMFQN